MKNDRFIVASGSDILYRTDEKEDLEHYIQTKSPDTISIYQLRYTSEAVLCTNEFEDELYLTGEKDNEQ